jgi:hypothetical protein
MITSLKAMQLSFRPSLPLVSMSYLSSSLMSLF